ncbi:MAG: sulfatase-like hydrolase/transferase [Verrucomicrobia bacterium]|mgnify:CR=1 FL=1|jgi:hypothetical protein|nr:sulfatase-like hydrolase/transferase [Verrucomicrobiota bacterium]MBT7698987.1 sulfatase-like hydrolase/transferase [Verrucomicrobiota bacterium]
MKRHIIAMGIALLGGMAMCTAGERPNVILVYMDDMGWSDIGTQGAVGFKTPHLDRLADEGLGARLIYCQPQRGLPPRRIRSSHSTMLAQECCAIRCMALKVVD